MTHGDSRHVPETVGHVRVGQIGPPLPDGLAEQSAVLGRQQVPLVLRHAVDERHATRVAVVHAGETPNVARPLINPVLVLLQPIPFPLLAPAAEDYRQVVAAGDRLRVRVAHVRHELSQHVLADGRRRRR